MEEQTNTDGMANPAAPVGPLPWMLAVLLVTGAVVALFVLSVVEARWLRGQPWSAAARSEGFEIEDAGAIRAWSRELSLEQSAGDSEIAGFIVRDLVRMAAEAGQRAKPAGGDGAKVVNPFDTKQMLDLSYLPRASLVMLDMPPADFAPLLASGRLPEAGKREVLAGPLLSDRDLEIGGETFTVVGQLRPEVRGFVKAFVLPVDEAMRAVFSEESGGQVGSVVPDGARRIRALVPALFDSAIDERPNVHLGPVPTRPWIAWGVWLSLLSAAVGASIGFITAFRRLARLRIPIVATAMRETVLRKELLWGLHIFLFGGFFGAMAIGMQDPELNHLFTEYAAHTFTEGDLKYVGDAYLSGSIPHAAHATFHNNFIVQTLYFTVCSTLVFPIFLGVMKTLLSFLVVGFAMAPVWTETASGMTYHVITLVLELPPYVLASFGVAVWSLCALRFFWSPVQVWYLGDKARDARIIEDAVAQLPRGLLVLAGCTALAAVFLYVAAWYEAATLILFR